LLLVGIVVTSMWTSPAYALDLLRSPTGQTTVIRAGPASCRSICPQRASAGRMGSCRYARRRPTVHQARPRARFRPAVRSYPGRRAEPRQRGLPIV